MASLMKKVAAGFGAVAVSSVTFAQASGVPAVDTTSTVAAISNVVIAVTAIGGAVLGVVVCAWGYKTVKGFLGR